MASRERCRRAVASRRRSVSSAPADGNTGRFAVPAGTKVVEAAPLFLRLVRLLLAAVSAGCSMPCRRAQAAEMAATHSCVAPDSSASPSSSAC